MRSSFTRMSPWLCAVLVLASTTMVTSFPSTASARNWRLPVQLDAMSAVTNISVLENGTAEVVEVYSRLRRTEYLGDSEAHLRPRQGLANRLPREKLVTKWEAEYFRRTHLIEPDGTVRTRIGSPITSSEYEVDLDHAQLTPVKFNSGQIVFGKNLTGERFVLYQAPNDNFEQLLLSLLQQTTKADTRIQALWTLGELTTTTGHILAIWRDNSQDSYIKRLPRELACILACILSHTCDQTTFAHERFRAGLALQEALKMQPHK